MILLIPAGPSRKQNSFHTSRQHFLGNMLYYFISLCEHWCIGQGRYYLTGNILGTPWTWKSQTTVASNNSASSKNTCCCCYTLWRFTFLSPLSKSISLIYSTQDPVMCSLFPFLSLCQLFCPHTKVWMEFLCYAQVKKTWLYDHTFLFIALFTQPK